MKLNTKSIAKTFDSKLVTRIKRTVLYVFIGLVVLDIAFVGIVSFPTISQVVFDSSPQWLVLIWLFGITIANLFFQRTAKLPFNNLRNLMLLLIMMVALWLAGWYIEQPKDKINCQNYTTEIPKYEKPFITHILCHDYTNGVTLRQNLNCMTMVCNPGVEFKVDLTLPIKLLLLISGILAGYILWPKNPEVQP